LVQDLVTVEFLLAVVAAVEAAQVDVVVLVAVVKV
jgi:hypothetical protein